MNFSLALRSTFVTSLVWRKHDLKPFRNEPTTTFNNVFTCNIYIKMLKNRVPSNICRQSYIKVMTYIMNLFLLHLIVSFLGLYFLLWSLFIVFFLVLKKKLYLIGRVQNAMSRNCLIFDAFNNYLPIKILHKLCFFCTRLSVYYMNRYSTCLVWFLYNVNGSIMLLLYGLWTIQDSYQTCVVVQSHASENIAHRTLLLICLNFRPVC